MTRWYMQFSNAPATHQSEVTKGTNIAKFRNVRGINALQKPNKKV